MSVHVSSWAWKQPVPDAAAKLVLLKLADNANDEGVCWPSQETIARECGLSLRTINTKIADLEALELLKIRRRGKTKTNVYSLQVMCKSNISLESDVQTVAFLEEPSQELSVVDANASPTAQTLIGEFVDQAKLYDLPLPRRIIGHLAKETQRLLDEGFTADQIRAAYGRMAERGVIQPSLLGNFMLEAALPKREPMRYGRGLTTRQILNMAKEEQ